MATAPVLTVDCVRVVGRLKNTGSPVFSGRVIGEPERRITFRADRAWAMVLATYIASHGDDFHTDVKPEDVLHPDAA